MADEDLSKLKVAELKELLVAAGLSVKGRKAELIERLTEVSRATGPPVGTGRGTGCLRRPARRPALPYKCS